MVKITVRATLVAVGDQPLSAGGGDSNLVGHSVALSISTTRLFGIGLLPTCPGCRERMRGQMGNSA